MRIHIKIEGSRQVIPYDHQPFLVGTIHKWMGRNDEHGNLSLYSFSRIEGCKATTEGLLFDGIASFFFSAHNPEIIKKLVNGIMSDRDMFNNLEVKEVILQKDPDLTVKEIFIPASPVLVKRRSGARVDHIVWDNPESGIFLKETLLTKMNKAGIRDDTLEIRFDTSYKKAGTKLVKYNGINNRANWCPVIIRGKPETKLFAWNVGLGNSTGIGFGAVR